jgi:RNA polymerase sigma-70 factor (sigma-E family)
MFRGKAGTHLLARPARRFHSPRQTRTAQGCHPRPRIIVEVKLALSAGRIVAPGWNRSCLPPVLVFVEAEGISRNDADVALNPGRDGRIEMLYERHVRRVGRLAYLLTGDRQLAEDIAHEAFVRAIGRLSALRRPEAFGSYLRRAVINLARKHWSRSATEARYVRREGPREVTRSTELPDITTRDEIWRALQSLPHDQRAAIVLRFFEDLSERDAAAALGCPRGTLKSRVSRGLEGLRIEMRGEPDGSN